MSKRSDPYLGVRLQAEQFLQSKKIDTLPISPFEIARGLGIELKPLPDRPGGASGMFVHVQGKFGICYPTHVKSYGFVNFSVAHELGHYLIPGHVEAFFDESTQHTSYAGFRSDNHYEREADNFAAALLMPSKLFLAAARTRGDGLKAIESLADLCKTSFEATAIRYAQTSPDPVAVIRSENNTIDYAFMSESLKDFSGIDWIRGKRTPLPGGSVTARFNATQSRIKNRERDQGMSRLQDWFNGPHSQEILEEVVGLGRYGKTLTVLTGMESPDEVEDDDEKLEDSWNPKF